MAAYGRDAARQVLGGGTDKNQTPRRCQLLWMPPEAGNVLPDKEAQPGLLTVAVAPIGGH